MSHQRSLSEPQNRQERRLKSGRAVVVQSLKNQIVIADKCLVAECFWDRFRGLIGRSAMEPGEGMIFPRCKSVHMWMMKIPIDVVFVARNKPVSKESQTILTVTSLYENVRPWKISPLLDWKADDAIELPSGTLKKCGIQVGDELCFG